MSNDIGALVFMHKFALPHFGILHIDFSSWLCYNYRTEKSVKNQGTKEKDPMKSKKIRGLALVLLACMLSATACTEQQDSGETTDTVDLSIETEEEGEALGLPEDLVYPDETITILTSENILTGPEELTEDIDALSEAMYKRTVAVEDRLKVELEFVGVDVWQDTQNIARQSVNSGSDDYDMIFTCAQHQVNLVNEGLYMNLDDLIYIDIEKPWWNRQYMDSVAIVEGENYILFGDITYNTIQRTTCVFFNIDLLESKLNMVPDDLYDLVYDGEWTIDKFSELVAQVYEDNGDTKNDYEDIHGLVTNGAGTFNWLAYSCGLEFSSRDEDGYPVLNLNNETSISLCDKLLALTKNNPGTFNEGDNHRHIQKFGNGKALFLVNRVFVAGWEFLRVMEDDYGILPMPKYDESIDGYHSTVELLVQWGGVPVTVSNPDMVSAAAETLAYYSRMYTTPAYYETNLKLKQTRDDASMEMVDMIMDGRDTDFLFVNNLGGMGDIFKSVYNKGQNNFASIYASSEMAANANLSKLIKQVEDASGN